MTPEQKEAYDVVERWLNGSPYRVDKNSVRIVLNAALAASQPEPAACGCTKVQQDETCPVGYPSLLCAVCSGTGILPAPAKGMYEQMLEEVSARHESDKAYLRSEVKRLERELAEAQPAEPNFAQCCASTNVAGCDCVNKDHIHLDLDPPRAQPASIVEAAENFASCWYGAKADRTSSWIDMRDRVIALLSSQPAPDTDLRGRILAVFHQNKMATDEELAIKIADMVAPAADTAQAVDGPERLWLGAEDDDHKRSVWFEPDEGGTPYIRADLAHPAPLDAEHVREARHHAIELEQCAIFAADVGDSIAKAMTDAAAFLKSLAGHQEPRI